MLKDKSVPKKRTKGKSRSVKFQEMPTTCRSYAVRQFISNDFTSQNLRLEAFATLSLSQVKNLQMLHEDRQLSVESVQLINEYVKDLDPRNDHSEPISAGYIFYLFFY